ncbi:hypothetical protein sscle_11g083610 [Sclerotinia sclerotiorum 1980 UF-70]|uniref:TauD/TfdA-like domain-containing protein n=1 Tax=Sclerotinia sclerotiorum (strain ATCC 18683 / 1980 / Ss-1) TaxID=665079 RepID=A0A1D9QFB1_SCLS1|nr:hypothetical protein sscle_11g083610 [Sclerotinia sclerotiorum 1980 UF-70]
MSALRLGLKCGRRAVTSRPLLAALRVSHIHRRLFATESSDTNQPSLHDTPPSSKQTSGSQNAKPPLDFEINDSSQVIKVNGVAYPPLFLRDACGCHRCVDPSTKQKNFQTSDIPSGIRATSILTDGNGNLIISWNNDIPGYGSDHVSSFSEKFFETNFSPKAYHNDRRNTIRPIRWNAERIAKNLQYVTFDDYINTEEGLFRALIMLRDYGLLILRDVPESETSVVDIAKRVGNLRDTLYGVTWDVKSVSEAKNVAYTSQYLGLHMDLLYMTNPPGFQFLHCLRNTCSGGSSIFSDAFHAAAQLDEHNFDELCRQKVPYHYRNAGEHYFYKHRVISSKPPKPKATKFSKVAAIRHINYSPPFQATFDVPENSVPVAEALRQFASRVEAPENMYEYRLQEGECVIFNNRRVLHGRKEFDTSAGERWLKGAYIDTDVFVSRYRVLAEKYQNQNQDFLRTHARLICWDIENPETGRMESDPLKVWETSRDLPQTEGYANII